MNIFSLTMSHRAVFRFMRWCIIPLLLLGAILFVRPLAADVQDDCTISYDKSASPLVVDMGGVVNVMLTLQSVGNCSAANSPIDVALVIDRSGSMSGQPIADAKSAAISFVQQMNLSVDQVAVASFASTGNGRLDQQLSQNAGLIAQRINGLYAGGMTNIVEGLDLAEAELNSARHRSGNAPIIIILSDGEHNESGEPFVTAARIKQAGIRIISIGLGRANEYQLKGIASSANDYYYTPNSGDLAAIYQAIAQTVRIAARNIVITDTLSDHVTLFANSFTGPVMPVVNGKDIVWRVAAAPTTPMVLSYQVAMTDQPGIWPTNDQAVADYLDADGNPASITFPVPQVEVKSACGDPLAYDVQPIWACQVDNVGIAVTGAGFFAPILTVGTQPAVVQNFTEHEVIGTLNASALPRGVYDVTVANRCPLSTPSSTLSSVFRVYGAPDVLEVRPREGYMDGPIDVVICGEELFAPGTIASLVVPTGTVPLEGQFIQANTPACIQGTIPMGPASWAGEREIVLENACGTSSPNRNGRFRILPSELNDDLWGRTEGLWVDPSVLPFANEDIKIGLMVHRRGGKNPVQVKVTFYENDPAIPGAVLVGNGTIPLLSPGIEESVRVTGTSTSAVGWIPSQGPGRYTLYAVIDPDDDVLEDIEDNNVVSRTIQVATARPPGRDAVAPRVNNLVVAGGADFVNTATISLTVQADDFAQPNVTPSGVQRMLFVEYIFNSAAGVWEPVQNSGWMPYVADTAWSLVQQSGLRVIQAWVIDGANNVSRFPYQRRVNYTRPCEVVARDGQRVYLVDVQQGDIVEVEVRSCSGDPDLYIWPPDTQAPPFVSNRANQALEYIQIPADRTQTGTYQVSIYGYSRAEYIIEIEVYKPDPILIAANLSAPMRISEDTGKDRRPAARLSGADTIPPVNSGNPPVVPAPAQIRPPSLLYLPMIQR
jgi:uncharacterized protein YegL